MLDGEDVFVSLWDTEARCLEIWFKRRKKGEGVEVAGAKEDGVDMRYDAIVCQADSANGG